MTLDEYKRKRHTLETPEPTGNFFNANKKFPIFVIQKHDASHLHYDFRLECKGVLLSWAVPKGLSMISGEKRLAAKVEDHPIDYAGFEGVIPEGNYGAGTVMVWDKGYYTVPYARTKEEVEKKIEEMLCQNRLTLILSGQKIKGEFGVVKFRDSDKDWLLIKKKDEFVRENDEINQKSVLTGRTMEEIAKEKMKTWSFSKGEIDLEGTPKANLPYQIKPMFAELGNYPFDNSEWIFELKLDGYRAIAELSDNYVNLYSRNLQSFNKNFPELIPQLKAIGREAILDGEIVVLDNKGLPNFQKLQDYSKSKQGTLVYYIFDIIYLDGYDLRNLPLVKRKEILSKILKAGGQLKYCDYVEEVGTSFFQAATELGLEGIMAKKKSSFYRPGARSRDWLKIKKLNTTEAVIGGYTEPRGGRHYFGALILGQYEDGKIKYIGHTGGGFTEAKIKEVYDKLILLEQKASSFSSKFSTNAPVHWVRPELVVEVKFAEWTSEGYLRQPIFLRIREDIDPTEVTVIESKKTVELSEQKSKLIKRINENEIEITNSKKIFWPEEKYTKEDLINYYDEISEFILPYLYDRPESLNRFPDGIGGDHFYHKNIEPDKMILSSWAKTIKIDQTNYLLCQNKETLIFIANLGCIEINPWSSRVGHLSHPDFCVIDLDPMDIDFKYVVEAAQVVHQILEKAKIKNFCKTSGITGLHVYIPLGARYDYEQSKDFGKIIATLVHQKLPKTTTVERMTQKRGRMVFLDYLQNNRGQTLAAPYSVRPVPGACVSTPLLWNEVNDKLSPKDFNIKNIRERVEKIGDIFSPVLIEETDLGEALEKLGQAFNL